MRGDLQRAESLHRPAVHLHARVARRLHQCWSRRRSHFREGVEGESSQIGIPCLRAMRRAGNEAGPIFARARAASACTG